MTTYIYQRSEWPSFRWDDQQIGAKLASIRHRQGRLLGRIEHFGIKLRDEALLQTLTEEVVKSSAIEGEELNRDQVRSSLARRLGIEIGTLAPADRHVEGIVQIILNATQSYDTPLTQERLFGWHAALFPTGYSNLVKITVGAWRPPEAGPMQVVSGRPGRENVHYEAPEAELIEKEMQVFLAWINEKNSGVDLVLKAGIAHLWFETIHPFDDGNGRMGRAIADMMLARSEKSAQRFYSISAQIKAEQRDYYAFLEETQKGDLEITPYLNWFLDCLGHAFDRAESILADVLRKAKFWELHAEHLFNERQKTMINKLLDGIKGSLTSSTWAKMTKTSQDTAGRDIEALLTSHVLVKEPGRGRSTNYVLVATPRDVLLVIAKYTRSHAEALPPQEADLQQRREALEVLATQTERLANSPNEACRAFEPILSELRMNGFVPEPQVLAALAFTAEDIRSSS